MQPIPGANDVLATVTDGNVTEKVTKGEVVNFLSRYPIPANENREQVYHDAVDSLVNTKLLTHFLNRQKIAVPPGQGRRGDGAAGAAAQGRGQDLATALLENNIAMDDIRKELENRIRWTEYVKPRRPTPSSAATSPRTATSSAAPRSGPATSC